MAREWQLRDWQQQAENNYRDLLEARAENERLRERVNDLEAANALLYATVTALKGGEAPETTADRLGKFYSGQYDAWKVWKE